MPTLEEYFNNDFKDLSLGFPITVKYGKRKPNFDDVEFQEVVIKARIRHNSDSSVRLFTFYVPPSDVTILLCKSILKDIEKWKLKANELEVIGGFFKDWSAGVHTMTYSNRVFIYTETQLTDEELAQIDTIGKSLNLYITFRSSDYLNRKIETEKPVAFISHDSRDKDLIASVIAAKLNSRLCHVWYDEYSLKVGDSLRESIEKGIKEAKKCILILTPNFLTNPGWTKTEFNSIFTRERIFNENIVLPIWYNVTKEQIFEYSPSLADRVALKWPIKESTLAEEYNREIEKIISKLHTQIIN